MLLLLLLLLLLLKDLIHVTRHLFPSFKKVCKQGNYSYLQISILWGLRPLW